MRKIRIMEHISLDGVIQQSADENDFPYGAWTAPYRTPAGRDAILAAYGERYDLLLGRRTCDMWSGFKVQDGSDLILSGSSTLTSPLLEHGLADEVLLWSSFRSCWARGSASLRRQPRHAHSSSSARKR
jgi:dihydrofolate reductase